MLLAFAFPAPSGDRFAIIAPHYDALVAARRWAEPLMEAADIAAPGLGERQ
jgi:hypothetical protein